MRRVIFPIVILLALLSSCAARSRVQNQESVEDLQARAYLQGVWVEDETGIPFMRITGDSLTYAEDPGQPLSFRVKGDSLFLFGQRDTISYLITLKGEQQLWIHSILGDVVRYHKSQDGMDATDFEVREPDETKNPAQQIQKDSVVLYNGLRYRGYVFINPTEIKVVVSAFDASGMLLERAYYDNTLYLCVYQGKKQVWAGTVDKQMLSSVLSQELLESTIMEDGTFLGADADGFHFLVTLSVPDSSIYCHVMLSVSHDGQVSLHAESGNDGMTEETEFPDFS